MGLAAALECAYFGVPAPLRFLRSGGSFVRELDPPVSAEALEVIMDVSRDGRISEVKFRNIPVNETPDVMNQARVRLERTRFRPAVISGKAAPIEQFVWVPPIEENQAAPIEEPGPVDEVPVEETTAVPAEETETAPVQNQGPANP